MTNAKQIILSYSSLIKYRQLQVQPPHQLQRQLNLQLQRPHHLQHHLRLADSMGMDERTLGLTTTYMLLDQNANHF
ncbi:hypothetical protein OUZ56_020324 [Daphnia magna]|uniref:Uncharacterized protein n=1 Tax=Daphnia magna TaxID=35525 RepID=A0ABQ9ZE68_9CRUS|nr:hypothetical protein OUZ56_020324 [Daphnia magna]